MESFAKLVGTPESDPRNSLLIPQKLVLREVEVKTSEAGIGPVYEHPAKDKLDFNNPIDTIYRHTSNQ